MAKLKSTKLVLGLGIVLALLIALFLWFRVESVPEYYPVKEVYVDNLDSIIIQKDSLIEPIVYHGNPNLRLVKGNERKELFINLMLPSIMIARKKVEYERNKYQNLHLQSEQGNLLPKDSILVDSLVTYFKCNNLLQVVEALEVQPVSIILAQAAIESGWGTSRFFLEANNVFGIWSYNAFEDRIAASQSRQENTVYLRKYDNLYGSVYDYLITVARAPAYKQFRKARLNTKDPHKLIPYLVNYSELREEYVNILRSVINHNNFTQYDHYKLIHFDENNPFWKNL
nr:glucosaminidase domain-containing protein [uncultured Carboxylicivirga sp.]